MDSNIKNKLGVALSVLSNYVVPSYAAHKIDQATREAAPLKWYIFREDCYDTLIGKHEISTDCIKFAISKGLGYLIIAGATIIKLP